MQYHLNPIGIIHSCYKEKFGIPRQAGLVEEAAATLELLPPYDREEALKGLEGFSHLWLIFIFHAALRDSWSPTVRPPRLGGNERCGVFSTRSPFRPNPIGLSAVAYDGYERRGGKLLLKLRGADLMEGTPVLDIKPYLPYADSLPQAVSGFAADAPTSSLRVVFSPEAEEQCTLLEGEGRRDLRTLIEKTLQLDPRPTYRKGESEMKQFGMLLYDYNVVWSVDGSLATVLSIR